MAFTMHCHSGEFCPGHAADQLEDIILHAISVGYETIGLSEHMPRYEERDLYPEEVSLHAIDTILQHIASHPAIKLEPNFTLNSSRLTHTSLAHSPHSIHSSSQH